MIINFIIDICKGNHPKISENTSQCYVDLMKKCWDLNPSNRPIVTELEYKISEWIRCIGGYYEFNKDGKYRIEVPNVDNNLKNDMLEFVEADNTLAQEQVNLSTIVQFHSQAYYTGHILDFTSKKLNEILESEDSQVYHMSTGITKDLEDCVIEDMK
jgi:hypothetical protein